MRTPVDLITRQMRVSNVIEMRSSWPLERIEIIHLIIFMMSIVIVSLW